jgi:hypothetical protein
MLRRAITEEEKQWEKELMDRGVVPEIEYGIEWRDIAPPHVVKPEKGEKFPKVPETLYETIKSLDYKIKRILELKQEYNKIRDELKETEKQLKEAQKSFTSLQNIRLDQVWYVLKEVFDDVDKVLNVAFQYKSKGEILVAFREDVESEEFQKLLTKDAGTLLREGKRLGIITDEMIKRIEEAIEETNRGILSGIKKFVKKLIITFFPAAKTDMSKLSAFGKSAGVMDMLKDLWHSVVERVSEGLEKLLGISREVAELGNEAVDIGYKLEEVGEVYGMDVKGGWNVPVNYEKGDIVGIEQKLGYKVEILAENVAKVGDELVVEKTAEDLCWKLFDRIMEGCGCEKKAVEYLEMVVGKYREKLEDMSKRAGWEKLPKGWTAESVEKFWDSLTGDVKHKVTKCIKLMDGKVDNPGAFCASLKDKVEGRTEWRGK